MKTSRPLVFAFNIKRKYFETLGLKHFANMQEALSKHIKDVILYPIITTDGASTIETRAKYIENTLPEVNWYWLLPYNSF